MSKKLITKVLNTFCKFQLNDLDTAEKYIDDAIIQGMQHPEIIETGIYHANKGLIHLKKGDLTYAWLAADHAKKLSEKSKNAYSSKISDYCLEQIGKAGKSGQK